MFWLFSAIILPHRVFLLGGVSFSNVNLVHEEWFFSRHARRTSRFNMMTINEIPSEPLREPKNPYWFLRHLLFLQVETLPYRLEILRWDFSLLTVNSSLTVGSWNSQSLPDKFAEPSATGKTNSPYFLGYQDFFRIQSSGIVFWCISLFQFSNLSNQNIFFPKFLPRTKHVLERFPKSSSILRFPVCQEVLVTLQIVIAFHRIRPPLIIRSRLQ